LAYGFCHVPASPGCHLLSCATWRPRPGWAQRLRQNCLGEGLQLLAPEASAGATERFRLRTEAAGSVQLRLGVILRHFGRQGVLC
ncbi:B9D2 protein, partial [Tricholaema leucomelas]|nr:B9D2 protein [Tricholaema leucomelas]